MNNNVKKLSEKNTYLNESLFNETLQPIFLDTIKDAAEGDEYLECYLIEYLEDYLYYLFESNNRSMCEYLHPQALSYSNFSIDTFTRHYMNNIYSDFSKDCKPFNVTLEQFIDTLDKGTDKDKIDLYTIYLTRFFFDTFGTYDLDYIFHDFIKEVAWEYQQELQTM